MEEFNWSIGKLKLSESSLEIYINNLINDHQMSKFKNLWKCFAKITTPGEQCFLDTLLMTWESHPLCKSVWSYPYTSDWMWCTILGGKFKSAKKKSCESIINPKNKTCKKEGLWIHHQSQKNKTKTKHPKKKAKESIIKQKV